MEKKNLEKSVLICGLSYKPNVEDMRDSSSFKIIKELKRKNFKVYGYDPYFNIDYVQKYLQENKISELDFERIEKLDDEKISNISCMCIVQHHEIDKSRILEIYQQSLIPCIYDCQTKLRINEESKTKLIYLGD